jgi:2'-5' RNA ligase
MARRLHRLLRSTLDQIGFRDRRKVRTLEIAYVIIVSDEVHNYMSKRQLEILRQFGWNQGLEATPHITLKLGFPVEEIGPFEEYFDKLLEEVEPLPICVKDIGFFDEGIIFMNIEHSPQLESLRRRIVNDLSIKYGIVPYPLEDERYRFHGTLGYVSRRDLPTARMQFEGVKAEFHFMLDTLAILCHTGKEWVTYKRGKLLHPS